MKTATQNACKLCTPLGASLAYKGIESTIPLLHGSQGCATYIRRYTISHFREPVDIASTSFTEHTAIFGGSRNLNEALNNLIDQYHPKAIGIATTCLSETIGEDIKLLISDYMKTVEDPDNMPVLFTASTPSYSGTHAEGYWTAIGAVFKGLTQPPSEEQAQGVVLTPGLISPEDMRHLKRVFKAYNYPLLLMGDYSDTLDGGVWEEYKKISPGGTPVAEIERAADYEVSMDFTVLSTEGGSKPLQNQFETERLTLAMPIGIQLSDQFHRAIRRESGIEVPLEIMSARNRLLDAVTDGHKYCFGKKAVVYGEADLVYSLAVFLEEVGITPVICSTGSDTPEFKEALKNKLKHPEKVQVETDLDFDDLESLVTENSRGADFLIGNSKGFKLSRLMKIPLIRVGFPIHDRFGGARVRMLDYEGSLQLYDLVVNTLLRIKQENSEVPYTYQ